MLLLNGSDVEQLTNMPALIEAIESGLVEEAAGEVVLPARMNLATPNGFFRIMPAVINKSGFMGFKAFHGSIAAGVRYLIALYEIKEGNLLAFMDAHYLTAARTGATTAIATKMMTDPVADSVAVIGSGLEARTNLAGVCAVRPIKRVSVFSPRKESRQAFALRMTKTLGIPVTAADSAEQCVREAPIVVVATNTSGREASIAFQGSWMRPGVHVNSIGSTMPSLREIDSECFARAERVVFDAREQAEGESGDLIAAIGDKKYDRGKVLELKNLLEGTPFHRRPDEITLFKSVGTALQDVMAGAAIYSEAMRRSRGQEVAPFLDLKTF